MKIRIEVAIACASLAFSALAFACAAPTEGGEEQTAEPAAAEHTTQESEALGKGGSSSGGGSTCLSRYQSCYISCGAIYGNKDPGTQAQCEALCDEIYNECSVRSPIGGSSGIIAF